MKTKKKTTPLALAAVLASAATLLAVSPADASRRERLFAGDNVVRFHLGAFEPDGDSEYWEANEEDFTSDAADFEDVVAGAEYQRYISGRIGVVGSLMIFNGEETSAFRDFVDTRGDDIFHTTDLEIVSLTAGLRLDLLRRDRVIVPYVGVGGGLYAWSLVEEGDFIDFDSPEREIFFGIFEEDGVTTGWYWNAGLSATLGRKWSVFAEARWSRAEDELEGDFEGLGDLDLGGRSVTGGVSWTF